MPPSLAQPTRRGTAALLPALGLSAQTAVPAAEPPLFAIQAFAIEVHPFNVFYGGSVQPRPLRR